MRCVSGVPATIRASRREVQHTSAQATMSSTHASWAIVTEWVGAGALSGLYLGATFGLLLGILAGPLFAVVSVPIGGLIGLVSGVAAGVMNGIELACLFGLGLLGQTQSSRRRRAALVAGLTSAVVSFAIFDWANSGGCRVAVRVRADGRRNARRRGVEPEIGTNPFRRSAVTTLRQRQAARACPVTLRAPANCMGASQIGGAKGPVTPVRAP